MKFKWWLLIIIVSLFSLHLIFEVDAVETLGTFQVDRCVELLQTCANCTYVNITSVQSPDGTLYLENVPMTQSGFRYNYSFCNSNQTGRYVVNGVGDDDGLNDVFSYDFYITNTGITPSDQRSDAINIGVYFFFIIGAILFMASFILNNSKPVKWTFFVFSIIFWVAALNIISINLTDQDVNSNLETFFDSFTAISFYFYWFAGGLLALMWIFTFFNTWIYKKNLRAAQKYGGF